jgi:hypothetical protein
MWSDVMSRARWCVPGTEARGGRSYFSALAQAEATAFSGELLVDRCVAGCENVRFQILDQRQGVQGPGVVGVKHAGQELGTDTARRGIGRHQGVAGDQDAGLSPRESSDVSRMSWSPGTR